MIMDDDDDDGTGRDPNEFEEDDSQAELLRDRFRISAIAVAEAEAKKNAMEISPAIVACVSDLAFKYAEQLAKDLELFAHHAGRKTVNMEDVILCGHRNNHHLSAMLSSLRDEMKASEPQSERKSKKSKRKDNMASTSGHHHTNTKSTHAATDTVP